MDAKIVIDAIRDSVWKPQSVAQEPKTSLCCWKVFEVTLPSGAVGVHFVGYTGQEGRVSSPIQNYSHVLREGVSRSGRVYTLEGPPGWHADGAWVWNQWCRLNACTFKEITENYT